jgi:hypothetical protein
MAQDGLDVVERLTGLRGDVAPADDLAVGVDRHLSRDLQHPSLGLPGGLREGAEGLHHLGWVKSLCHGWGSFAATAPRQP